MEITVEKSGSITGIGRYTEIPFTALELSLDNMIFPEQAEKRVFSCKESKKEGE